MIAGRAHPAVGLVPELLADAVRDQIVHDLLDGLIAWLPGRIVDLDRDQQSLGRVVVEEFVKAEEDVLQRRGLAEQSYACNTTRQ